MKFSVLVANYNNGKYLKDVFESILSQTYHDWELVIVDDASTDNSDEIINDYLPNANIKYIRHSKNKGAGATFKTAADNATGDKLEEVGKFEYVKQPIYFYRQHNNGISQNENGLKAAQYSILAQKDAYLRRLSTSLPNLSKEEFGKIMSTYHIREAFVRKKQCFQNAFQSVDYQIITLFSKPFWSILLRNFIGI